MVALSYLLCFFKLLQFDHSNLFIYITYVFHSVRKGSPGYLVVVNGGTEPRHIDFTKVEPIIGASSEGEAIAIPFDAQIEVSSVGTSNTAG